MEDIRTKKILRVFKGGHYLEISGDTREGWMKVKTGDFPSVSMFGDIDICIQVEFARSLANALLEVADIADQQDTES